MRRVVSVVRGHLSRRYKKKKLSVGNSAVLCHCHYCGWIVFGWHRPVAGTTCFSFARLARSLRALANGLPCRGEQEVVSCREWDRKDSTSRPEGCVEVGCGGGRGTGWLIARAVTLCGVAGGLVIIDASSGLSKSLSTGPICSGGPGKPFRSRNTTGAGRWRGKTPLSTAPSGHMRQTARRRFVQRRSRQPQQ